jgi:signal transduction histidine kinase
MKPGIISEIVSGTIDYLKARTSSKIKYTLSLPVKEPSVPVNTALFGWVVENVCKNAIDATGGEGEIHISISSTRDLIITDIRDSGKGIPGKSFKAIFKPGYTTKKHGWGLGLSLSKRIIEEYHKGKIFVRYSDPVKGTCLRIQLPVRQEQ